MRRLFAMVLIAACHRPPAAPPAPSNAVASSPTVTLAVNQPLGWIALATTPAPVDDSWLPVSAQLGVVIAAPADTLPARVTAIDVRGATTSLVPGAPTRLPYGCDNNALEVRPLEAAGATRARLAPGPVWLLPPAAPVTWEPAAVPVRSTHADPTRRSYAAGPLAFELSRSPDPTRGRFQIFRAGRQVHEAPITHGEMEGADAGPLDLSRGGPGIPAPVGVWSLSPSGPFLVALLHPGYEGVTLSALVVDATTTTVRDDLVTYLYACAF